MKIYFDKEEIKAIEDELYENGIPTNAIYYHTLIKKIEGIKEILQKLEEEKNMLEEEK